MCVSQLLEQTKAIPTLLPLWSVPDIFIESPMLIFVLSKLENRVFNVADIPFTVLNAEPCNTIPD